MQEPEAPAGSPESPPPRPAIKLRRPNQTVCDEPSPKEKFCYGHLKLFAIAPKELLAQLPKGHQLFRCQRCGQLYEGQPLKHLH